MSAKSTANLALLVINRDMYEQGIYGYFVHEHVGLTLAHDADTVREYIEDALGTKNYEVVGAEGFQCLNDKAAKYDFETLGALSYAHYHLYTPTQALWRAFCCLVDDGYEPTVETFRDAYRGIYESPEDFMREELSDTVELLIRDNPRHASTLTQLINYVDYGRLWQDARADSGVESYPVSQTHVVIIDTLAL